MKTREMPEMFVSTIEFRQEPDSFDDESGQQITIDRRVGGVPGRDDYWAIKTDGWSIESIDDVVQILRRAGVRESHDSETPKFTAGV
jgi:hypothetical protein